MHYHFIIVHYLGMSKFLFDKKIVEVTCETLNMKYSTYHAWGSLI